MHSIVEAVSLNARQQPERPAIFFEGQTLRYGELYADVERFAQALLTASLQAGERVALFLENSPAFVVSYLGTHLAGGIVVLVNTEYRQVELSHIMNDAGVRFCVTSPAGRSELLRLDLPTVQRLIIVGDDTESQPGASIPSLAYTTFLQSGTDAQHALSIPAPDAPATVGYTSSTTGRAKGALLLQRNLLANIQTLTQAWRWSERDHLLLTLPLFHTHGLMVGMHGTLFQGACVTLRRKFDATDVLTTLHTDESITLFFGVPTMYSRLLAEAKRQGIPTHLPRLFVSGSAPLSAQLFKDFARVFGQPILERYGMAEIFLQFETKGMQIHTDIIHFPTIPFTPDGVQQRPMREHFAPFAHEDEEQRTFYGCQVDDLPTNDDRAFCAL